MDDDGNPTLDTPETIAAIQYVLDLRDKYNVIPAARPTTRRPRPSSATTYAASVIDGSWSWDELPGGRCADPALAAPRSTSETGLYARPMAAAKAYSLNPAVPDWKLPAVLGVMRLLTDDAIQADMARELATIPVRTRRPGVGRDGRRARLLRPRAWPRSSTRCPMPTQPQMRQIWDAMRGPYQLVMNGGVTAEEGARLMQEQAEKRIADTFLN